MNNVLVYGASGFIGERLVSELIACNVNVIAVIPDSSEDEFAYKKICKYPVKVIECNLEHVKDTLYDKLQQEQQSIDVVYFLAWDGLNNEGLLDYECQINNVKYLLNLLEVASKLGAYKFIGSGSITQQELFREEGRNYLTDKHRYYRSAQQMCEDMGRALAKQLGIIFIWPLITNVYGVGEKSPRLINSLIRSLLNNEDFPTSEGNQLYDFIYIDDVAKIYYKLGIYGKENRKYIIGSGKARKLKEYLLIVERLINNDSKVCFGKFVYDGMYYSKEEFDTTILFSDIKYNIENSFEDGIIKTINWISKEGL